MRKAFIDQLTCLAEVDRRIVLLTADLGFGVVEGFAAAHPDRFFNVGVAEQNMVGVATGLASAGLIPFVYSISTFAVLRPYEFLRNGPVLHQSQVRVVGTGAGVEYGHNGTTHFALEDVAVLRALPGIDIVAPADSAQAVNALRCTWDQPGPVYFRLGKNEDVVVPGLDGRFDESGIASLVGPPEGDVLVLALGTSALAALEGRDRVLAVDPSASVSVAVVSRIHAASFLYLADVLARFRRIVVVEAHNRNGGLGSLVAEVACEHGLGLSLTRLSADRFPARTGSQSFLEGQLGIDADAVARAVAAQTAMA